MKEMSFDCTEEKKNCKSSLSNETHGWLDVTRTEQKRWQDGMVHNGGSENCNNIAIFDVFLFGMHTSTGYMRRFRPNN